jgi:chaperonin GroEL (HSP60 family)
VAGGGVTFLKTIGSLDIKSVGGKILEEALKAPYLQIYKNLGLTEDVVDFGDEVVDPSIVVKNSIKNAISISSNILTGRVVVTAPKN